MKHFPNFLKKAVNAVDAGQLASGLKGYVFEGADGCQLVMWECTEGGTSPTHTHDYDEYCIVIEGVYSGNVGDAQVVVGPGEECFIPAGVPHGGSFTAGYRAIDGFGGRRVKRQG